uniref:Uncharacterized protein n=1 Tax=Fagus sylvatica TaxID=28930 RepID=A0A2N9I0Y9_FAGSY
MWVAFIARSGEEAGLLVLHRVSRSGFWEVIDLFGMGGYSVMAESKREREAEKLRRRERKWEKSWLRTLLHANNPQHLSQKTESIVVPNP